MRNLIETGGQQLKPMSISEIVSVSFSILSRRYFEFVLPFLIISLIEWLFSAIFRGFPPLHYPFFIGIVIFGAFGSIVLALVFNAISTGIVTQLAADEFLGKETSLKKSFNVALDVLPSIIVGAILVGIIVLIGFILLVIPGIIFLVWLCLTPTVIVLERKEAVDAVGRSKKLTKGKWFHTSGVIVIIFVILWIASSIGSAISGLFALALPRLFTTLVEKIISSLISPIYGVIITVLYFDLLAREKLEAFLMAPAAPYPKPEVKVEEVPTITYRYCPYCGAPLPPDAKFCPKCGASVE